MEITNIINEAKNMSKWEKIDSGLHNFYLNKVEYRLTDKSKRQAIIYNGFVKNSKGLDQIVNVVDLVDTQESLKYGIARLIQFINYFGGDVEDANTIEEMLNIANSFKDRRIQMEFVKKVVNGAIIKEKVFLYK